MIEHTHAGPLHMTHDDADGIRIVQRCTCGAWRALNMWHADPSRNLKPTWSAGQWTTYESKQTS